MDILVVNIRTDMVEYSFFASGNRMPQTEGKTQIETGRGPKNNLWKRLLPDAHTKLVRNSGPIPVALRVHCPQREFPVATVANKEILAQLQHLIPRAPLHIPRVLRMVTAVRKAPVVGPPVLVFENAFFANLPRREKSYGLPPEPASELKLERHGYHGLFHQMACHAAVSSASCLPTAPPVRLLSICLEPKPEVCAVIDGRPITVSSGTTPVEGVPGETTSGDLDPGIVLQLLQDQNWGPEKVDRVLCRESGIKGLTGRDESIDSVLTSPDNTSDSARRILEYRIQLASGAGIAAIGGIDGIVFSGEYADAAKHLGPRVAANLADALPGRQRLPWTIYRGSRHRIMADVASTVLPPDESHSHETG